MERWLHPDFQARLLSHDWRPARVLDVGTGRGNPAMLLGELGATVVGIDYDLKKLADARADAAGRGLSQVTFLEANAETADYALLCPGITAVTAHLCMSEGIVRRAAAALPPGGRFVFCAHHPDHHRETGRAPTFGMAEDLLAGLLEKVGFSPEHLRSNVETRQYASFEGLLEAFGASPKQVKLWEPLRARFASGERHLTRAHVIGDAVRR